MRNRTKALLAGLALALVPGTAAAAAPALATVDAQARASGNLRDLAVTIGESIFTTLWPAQVSQVSANGLGSHVVAGVRVWGVKFHQPLTRAQFVAEVTALIGRTLAAAPAVGEVDLWVSVPIRVGKDVVVSGDLAKPTSRVVYSITARRGEAPAALARRAASGPGVFWDEEWAGSAFKVASK